MPAIRHYTLLLRLITITPLLAYAIHAAHITPQAVRDIVADAIITIARLHNTGLAELRCRRDTRALQIRCYVAASAVTPH